MLTAIGLVALGLLVLIAGGEVLLRGAVGLATLLRLTPAVIGLTVVAAGTSVPELAVSAAAAARGSTDITVGNVVGSNLFNVCVVLGLSGLIRPLLISGNTIRLEYPVMALVTLMMLAVTQDGSVNRLDAVLFLAIYVAFTAYLVSLVREQMNLAEVKEFRQEVKSLAPATAGPQRRSAWPSLAMVGAGVALLAGGAHVTVMGAVELARLLGMTERVIGLTVVAAGTSLPEVITSVVANLRGRDDVAIGNVIGSNLFNILGILGISGAIAPLQVNPTILASDNWWMLGTTLLLLPMLFTGRRINRFEALILLLVYGTYMALLLGLVAAGAPS